MVNGRLSMVNGQWSSAVGRWSFVVSRWSFVVGPSSSLRQRQPGRAQGRGIGTDEDVDPGRLGEENGAQGIDDQVAGFEDAADEAEFEGLVTEVELASHGQRTLAQLPPGLLEDGQGYGVAGAGGLCNHGREVGDEALTACGVDEVNDIPGLVQVEVLHQARQQAGLGTAAVMGFGRGRHACAADGEAAAFVADEVAPAARTRGLAVQAHAVGIGSCASDDDDAVVLADGRCERDLDVAGDEDARGHSQFVQDLLHCVPDDVDPTARPGYAQADGPDRLARLRIRVRGRLSDGLLEGGAHPLQRNTGGIARPAHAPGQGLSVGIDEHCLGFGAADVNAESTDRLLIHKTS